MIALRHRQAARTHGRWLVAAAGLVLAGCASAPQPPAATEYADDARERADRVTDERTQRDRNSQRQRGDGLSALERDMDQLSPAVRMPLGVRSGF